MQQPIAGVSALPAGAKSPGQAAVTKPGFKERKPLPPKAGAHQPGAKAGGGPAAHSGHRGGGGGGGGGGGAKPHKPSLGDPTLDKWRAAAGGGIGGVKPGDVGDGSEAKGAIADKKNELDTHRKGAVTDPVADAKSKQPPLPAEQPKAATLDTSGAEAAVSAVQAAGNHKLADQSFAPPGMPTAPSYLNAHDYVPQSLTKSIADLESKLADPNLSKTDKADLTAKLEAAKAKVASIEKNAGTGTAAQMAAVHDEGPAKLTPPDPAMGDVLGDAIARAMTSVPAKAEGFVKKAVGAAHGDKVPKMLEMGTAEKPILETDLRTELTGVATAAGLSEDQLKAKVTEQQKIVEKQAGDIQATVQQATTDATKATEDRSQQEGAAVAGAKVAVEREIEEKRAAVQGPPDTKAIEAKRDEFLAKLQSASGQLTAGLQASLTKRLAQLDEAATQKKSAITSSSKSVADAVRRHWSADTDPNKGMVEARPTVDWGASEAARVDAEAKALKAAATAEHDGFAAGITRQTSAGTEKIRDWAAHQEGTERSWWDRLVEMFSDWGHQAAANNEAWEKQRNAETRDAMSQDLSVLANLREAQLTHNGEAMKKEFARLDKDQQELANTYFKGGMDSIGFVAESTMLRIGNRRTPELAKTFEERAIAEWGWEDLGQLARATNPGFQPKVLADKVHGGVDGWGTNEKKVYEGLGGAKSAVERAALDKCYTATFGASMAADVRDDMSDKELDRAEALMVGDAAKADAATIAEAIDGLGTDEEAIKNALRGKTKDELDAIKSQYRAKYGVDMIADIKEDESGAELDNALALADGDVDKADAAELEDAMSGPGTDEDKMKQVYERIRQEEEQYAKQHSLTKAELDQRIKDRNGRVKAKYGEKYGDLDANARDELSDGDSYAANNADNKLFTALQEGDTSKIDAAKALVEHEGVYASDDELEKIARNQRTKAEYDVDLELGAERARLAAMAQAGDLTKDELEAEKKQLADKGSKDTREAAVKAKATANMGDLKEAYDQLGARDDSGQHQSFDQLINQETNGYSQLEIQDLVASGGKLSDDQEIYYAIAGVGTDEDQLKNALKGKTPDEIKKIKLAYEKNHGEGSFESDILGDLSGREDLDVGLTLKYGDPSTFKDQLDHAKTPAERQQLLANFKDYLDKRTKFEQTGAIGGVMALTGDGMNSAQQIADAVDRAEKYDAALTKFEADPDHEKKKKEDDPNLVGAGANFDMNFQGAVQAQEEVREHIDAITDVAAQVGAAVAGIGLTIITFGALGPVVAAAYATEIAAAAALMSMATSVAIKATLKGSAYGWEDAGVDLAIGTIDTIVTVATAGAGKAAIVAFEEAMASQMSKLAAKEGAEKMTESAVKAFVREAAEEAIQNGIQAIPSAFAGGLLNGEDPLTAMKGAGMAGAQGAGMGVGIHGLKTAGGAALKGIKGALKGEPTIETKGPTVEGSGGAHGEGEGPHAGTGESTAPSTAGGADDVRVPELDDPTTLSQHPAENVLPESSARPQVDETPNGARTNEPEEVRTPGTKETAPDRVGAAPETNTPEQAVELTRPNESDIGKALSNEDLAKRYGMPEENVAKIKKICADMDVIIDVRPTTPYAEPMLREEVALPKPEKLKAKTINELDVQLGLGGEGNLGKVGFFPPEDIHFPDNFDSLPVDQQDALKDRAKRRSEEFNSYSKDMANLIDKGKIRLEPDGTITNTGLIEGGEKPFTGDHDVFDIRKADGTKLSAEEYNAVKQRLMEEKCDVMHGAVTGWEHDNPATFSTPEGQAEYNRMVAEHSAGGKEPLVRFGEGEPKGVWHEPAGEPGAGGAHETAGAPTEREPRSGAPDTERDPRPLGAADERAPDTIRDKPEVITELPDGSSMTFEGGKFDDAKTMYDNNIADSPRRETALMRNRITDEYVIIQGKEGAVSLTHSNFSELFPDHPDQWELLRHSHPTPGEGKVMPVAETLPSGNGGDLSVVMARAERFGEPQTSIVDFQGPNGPEQTTFGYDPKSKEIFVDYPNPDGGRKAMRFASLEDYHTWYEGEFPDHSAGDSFEPPTVREGRGAVGDNETVKTNEPVEPNSSHDPQEQGGHMEPGDRLELVEILAEDHLQGHPQLDNLADEATRVRRLLADPAHRAEGLRSLEALEQRVAGMTEHPIAGGSSSAGGIVSDDTPWEPPNGSPAPPAADAPATERREWVLERLREHVHQAVELYDIEGLTPNQERALLDNPQMEAAFRGSRIDEFAKSSVLHDPELAALLVASDFINEPDFIDSALRLPGDDWFDATTARSWQDHLERYGARYGRGGGLAETRRRDTP